MPQNSPYVSRVTDGTHVVSPASVIQFSGATVSGTGQGKAIVTIAGAGGIKLTHTFTANGSIGTVPAGALILGVTLKNNTANSVDITLGTTAGASDVMRSLTVGTNAFVVVPQGALILPAFAAAQAIFVNSSAWNSASIGATLWYQP
jgi:hypothetical protein